MSDIALRVENLGKKYRIGSQQERYKRFTETVMDTITTPIRRLKNLGKPVPPEEIIWALKDVSFQVERGEVVGIIGRNGAGKTTLLKILSRITEPTEGRAEIHGRVGSLLEVGTGFHPELTGRENVYLNGAILGMRRAEIDRKFDEIVEFSGVEKFLDTPVKRYSSGMYVRLAFAVAAHLEPEILLVDEVLAVGDAQFQKKCLGKMGEVAQEGRTVLFVSHNMGMIRSLCERSILLVDGKIAAEGESSEVVSTYLSSWNVENETKGEVCWTEDEQAPGCDEIRLRSIRLLGPTGKVEDTFEVNEPISVEIAYQAYRRLRGMRIILYLTTDDGVVAFASTDHDQRPNMLLPGRYRSEVTIPGGLLNRKRYFVHLHFDICGVMVLIPKQEYLSFSGVSTSGRSYVSLNWRGVLAPQLKWTLEKLDSVDHN